MGAGRESPGELGTSGEPSEVLHAAPISRGSCWKLRQAEQPVPGGLLSCRTHSPCSVPLLEANWIALIIGEPKGFSKDGVCVCVWDTVWEEFPCPQVASATWT